MVEDDQEHADAAEEDGELVELVVGDHCAEMCVEAGLKLGVSGW